MIDDLLLPYQKEWISNNSKNKIWEKSRRIGASWTEALNSVLKAADREKSVNTYYFSTDKDNTQQFIHDCAFWAKKLNLLASSIEEEVVSNEDKDILVFQIRFSTGRTIKALPTKGEAIRSKQGRVVVDEAAFIPGLKGLIKASKPLLMWGGQLTLISTHRGESSHFNRLCEQVKSGDLGHWYHQKTTFKDAIEQGLYRRICLASGEQWSESGQHEWEMEIRADIGADGAEELDVIPQNDRERRLIDRRNFEVIPDRGWWDTLYGRHGVRFWDLAATSDLKNPNACWTAGVKMYHCFDKRTETEFYLIDDFVAERYDPTDTDRLILATAQADGEDVRQRFEQEGGASCSSQQ